MKPVGFQPQFPPLAGLKILFKAGYRNDPGGRVLAQATTDAAGRFEVRLPAGTYCLIDAKRQELLQAGKNPECSALCEYVVNVVDRPVKDLALLRRHEICANFPHHPCDTAPKH